LQWSTRVWPHSEHFISGVEVTCFGQMISPSPLRASYEMGVLFAEQVSVEHRSSARVLLSGPLCLRALYNPNFKASTRWIALPPSMPLISSTTEVVFSPFSSALRCFHPFAIISGCRAAKLEKVSAAMFFSVSFASMSFNAR